MSFKDGWVGVGRLWDMSEEERRIITIYLITCLIVIIILCIGKKKVFDILFIVTLSTSLELVIDYFLWLVSLGSSSSSSSSNCYLLT